MLAHDLYSERVTEESGRRRMAPEQRREQLLDAAVQLAAGGDLTALSVQEIAAHAGVSDGLLYHYFPTKQALLIAAVRRAAERMRVALDAALQGPPLESLVAGLGAYLDHVQADPTGWRALLKATGGELAAIAADVTEHSRALVLAGLGIPNPGPALSMALQGWSALEREVCLAWLEHPQVARGAVEDLLLSAFLNVLEATARHDPETSDVLKRVLGRP
jgi:AcrR family transcriptional regulator